MTFPNGLNSVVLHIGVDSLHGTRHQQLTFRTNVGPPHHSLAVLICALSSMMYPISKKLFEPAQRTSRYFTYHISLYIYSAGLKLRMPDQSSKTFFAPQLRMLVREGSGRHSKFQSDAHKTPRIPVKINIACLRENP